jgi:nucleotide-binding universal stress UspA family protein
MFDRLTVLTDGGPCGARALRVAGRLAAVASLPLEAVIGVDEAISDEEDEALRIQVAGQAPVPCIARVRRGRGVIETLVGALDHRPDALVCMGTRGHSPAGEAFLGSVAEAVLNCELLHDPDTADAIVGFTSQQGGGLIVIATRRWADPARRHWASTARRLVARSPFPVLVVPLPPTAP